MKIKKTIRLSEEATAALADIDNHSQYIEDLILGTPQGESRVFEVVPLKQLNEVLGSLLEPLLENNSKPVGNIKPQNTIGSPTANTRTMQDVLSDITRAERERDDILEWSQDPEEHRRVAAECTKKTTLLWAEWKELKNEQSF